MPAKAGSGWSLEGGCLLVTASGGPTSPTAPHTFQDPLAGSLSCPQAPGDLSKPARLPH